MEQNLFRQTRAFKAFMSELQTQIREVHLLVSELSHQHTDSADLREQFHKVKGSAGLFGYAAMGEIAAQIEQKLSADQCSLAELRTELRLFEQEVLRVIDGWPEHTDG